jgi:L-alanine-DL-glutamate epimerase-like enolase superfamily enzyme
VVLKSWGVTEALRIHLVAASLSLLVTGHNQTAHRCNFLTAAIKDRRLSPVTVRH